MQSRRSFVGTIFPLLSLVFGLSSLGHAVVPNRIASVGPEVRRPVQNTVSPRAKSSVDLGAAPSSLKLNGLMLQFNMTAAQQVALNQLLLDQKNPASPHYHQWLTPEEYGEQFGLSAGDIARVTSWLTAQGFSVTGVAKSANFVTFSGTAEQVQQAFGTTLHDLSRNGRRHIANLTDPVLPSAIASVVLNVSGLNDFRPEAHLRVNQVSSSAISANSLRPHFTNPNPGSPIQHAVAPADFNTIYDVTPLTSNGISGAGIGGCPPDPSARCGDIAVVGQVNINSYGSDLDAFRSAAGLPAARPTTYIYGTDPGAPSPTCLTNPTSSCIPSLADLQESLFDVEWAGAVAPSARILFVTSTNVIGSLAETIVENLAPIISLSYGQCENSISPSQIVGLTTFLQEASLQGITIIGPTGDDGATDCDTFVSSATKGLAVDYPGSSPYVTGIGGTMFDDDASPSTYWNSSNGPGSLSARSYIPEKVWNETAEDITQSPPTFGAGGGGASIYFVKPAWQIVANGVPNDGLRDVPDISLNAASNHDGYLICLLDSCSNGQFYNTSNGNGGVFGGTSAAVPAFAGVMALVEQSLNLGRLGNINPNIYAMANGNQYNNIFHDITDGDNKSPCTAGSTGCPSGGTIGFTAGTGYDQASGWGSIDAAVFAKQWTSFPPTAPPGTVATPQTTVTANPNQVAAGTPVSLAVTVTLPPHTPPFVPTGFVEIQVDGTTVAPAVPLANGQVTYSLDTTALGVGPHTVTAIYSGDSNFGSSQGTTTITITGAATPIASVTTVIPTPSSVTAGTAISLAVSVAVAPGNTSANTPTGTVQIQVDGATIGTASTLVNGHATPSLNTSGMAPGNYTVTAVYSGDSNFTGSTGTATITITGTGTGGTIASRTTVTATPSSVTAGTAISLAIAVAPGSTSTNTPGGTVQIQVDGATVGSSTALTNGHASYLLSTSALTAGVHTVTAIYSGDTNFTGSQGGTTITILVPSTTSDFTITPSTASVSTLVGEQVPAIVFTLAPVNGFTGPITLTASDTSKDKLTPAFSLNPVVINSANGATTTLTFTAFQSLTSVRGGSSPFQPGSNRSAAGKTRWYVAGSGATLACMFLLILPRRRRWGALLAVLLSVGAIGASGCGSGGTLPTSATYNVTITATAAGNLSHTSTVNVTFRIR